MAFESDEAQTLRGMVAAGLGVTVLPRAVISITPSVVEVQIDEARRQVAASWSGKQPTYLAEAILGELRSWPEGPSIGVSPEPDYSGDTP